MDADADDEDDDYIPDAGGEVGTSSQVCGNGRQAVVPRGRASGRDRASGRGRAGGRGWAQDGVPRGRASGRGRARGRGQGTAEAGVPVQGGAPDLEELWGP